MARNKVGLKRRFMIFRDHDFVEFDFAIITFLPGALALPISPYQLCETRF